MSNKYYKIKKEVELTLKVKVTLTGISDYNEMDDKRQSLVTDEFEECIGQELCDVISGEYHSQSNILTTTDYIDYEVQAKIEVVPTKDESIPTYNLDGNEFEGVTLRSFVIGENYDDEECYIICKGIKYIANRDYTVNDFCMDYSRARLDDLTDSEDMIERGGFIKKVTE